MYIVDTDVLSAAAPTKAVPQHALAAWMDRNSAGLYLSVITIAEIEAGIARSRRTGAHATANRLTDWLATILHLYGDRVLPIDMATARQMGLLADHAREQGQDPGLADVAVAATASIHDYVVLSRNIRHFAPLGVTVRDPFDQLPYDMPV